MSTPTMTIDDVIADMGEDPQQMAADLRAFKKDTELVSLRRNALLKEYPQQWIAVCDGDVRASAGTLEDLLTHVHSLGLPNTRVVIRYVDRNVRRMIL